MDDGQTETGLRGGAYARRMATRARAALGIALLAIAATCVGALELVSASLAPTDRLLWRALAYQVSWSALAIAGAALLGGSLRDRLGMGPSRLGLDALAIGAVGTLALSAGLHFVLVSLELRTQGSLGRLDALVEQARPQSPWLVLIAFGIAPGFGEELLFRGLLQRGLALRFGAWGIPLAAAAFGLLHHDPIHSPAAFVLGCYLGALAFLARSTWAAVACHVANNTAAALQPLLGGSNPGLPQPTTWIEAGACLAVAALCIAFVLARARCNDRTVGFSSA